MLRCVGDAWLGMCNDSRGQMILLVVFGVQDDRPARRHDVVVSLEVIGLEANASKDRSDGQSLTIGEMDSRRRHVRSCKIPLMCMLLCELLFVEHVLPRTVLCRLAQLLCMSLSLNEFKRVWTNAVLRRYSIQSESRNEVVKEQKVRIPAALSHPRGAKIELGCSMASLLHEACVELSLSIF